MKRFCPSCHSPIARQMVCRGRIRLHAGEDGEPCKGTNDRPRTKGGLREPFNEPLDVHLGGGVRLVRFAENSIARTLEKRWLEHLESRKE